MAKPTRPPLDADFLRSVLDYDPITGIFRWRHRPDRAKNWNSKYAGKPAGSEVQGYIQIQVPKPQNYYAHTLAWLYVHGVWIDQIDHRNGVRSDNWIENLRPATSTQNACNKGMQSNNKSGFVGVSFNTQCGRWEASITVGGKRVFRQRFDTAAEAAEARKAALASAHGEFARLD